MWARRITRGWRRARIRLGIRLMAVVHTDCIGILWGDFARIAWLSQSLQSCAPGVLRWHRYHRPTRLLAMASETLTAVSAGQPLERLAGQLQSLSELTEALAYRLLDLEERLAAQDRRLQPLLEGPAAADPQMADTELRLDDTEERLTRLESLLSGLDTSGAAPTADPAPSAGDDPFFEEGEQAFMDMDGEQEPLALEFEPGYDAEENAA